MPSHPKRLYADTSFYYAALDSRDAHHGKALEWVQYVQSENLVLVSSWEIIVET